MGGKKLLDNHSSCFHTTESDGQDTSLETHLLNLCTAQEVPFGSTGEKDFCNLEAICRNVISIGTLLNAGQVHKKPVIEDYKLPGCSQDILTDPNEVFHSSCMGDKLGNFFLRGVEELHHNYDT